MLLSKLYSIMSKNLINLKIHKFENLKMSQIKMVVNKQPNVLVLPQLFYLFSMCQFLNVPICQFIVHINFSLIIRYISIFKERCVNLCTRYSLLGTWYFFGGE